MNFPPFSPPVQVIVSVSGGKDSTALLLLALEQDIPGLRAVFADTGNEHPQTYDFVHDLSRNTGIWIEWIRADFSERFTRKKAYIDTRWRAEGIPDADCDQAIASLEPSGNPFLDLCLLKGRFPSAMARFCTEGLKRDPIIEQVQLPLLERGVSIESWQGVRAEESRRRARLPLRELAGTFENDAQLWHVRPLLHWTAEEVFAMHRRHGICPNPLYRQGMARVGCMPCIYCRKAELREIARRFPEEIDRIERWEAQVSRVGKKRHATFFATANGRGDGIRQCVEWSRTRHGGRTAGFLEEPDEMPRCASIYGLCE